jgi:hypothetical protein
MRSRHLRRALLGVLVATCAGSLAAGADAATVHFKSPSGNINCFMFSTQGGVVDCIVRHASWPHPPPRPKSCDLDWMPFEVQLTGRHVVVGGCRGDIGPLCGASGGRCTVLAYGRSVTLGTVRCSSAPSGITCRRTTGPRHPGFLLAREKVVTLR